MPDHIDPVSRFIRTATEEHWTSLFPALEELSQAMIGHRLFSCSIFRKDDGAKWVAARIYTSDEENYPTSGQKEIVPTRWTDTVIIRRNVFLANSAEAFSDVFADHEKIASMGLGSVVNLPVTFCGQFLGTVNLLHETGYYSDLRASELKNLVLPSLLTFQLSAETAEVTRYIAT